MPTTRDTSLKDPELYEKLRAEGSSKEKAARISNAAARDGRSAVSDLRSRAKELGLTGYSDLRKHELIRRLREH